MNFPRHMRCVVTRVFALIVYVFCAAFTVASREEGIAPCHSLDEILDRARQTVGDQGPLAMETSWTIKVEKGGEFVENYIHQERHITDGTRWDSISENSTFGVRFITDPKRRLQVSYTFEGEPFYKVFITTPQHAREDFYQSKNAEKMAALEFWNGCNQVFIPDLLISNRKQARLRPEMSNIDSHPCYVVDLEVPSEKCSVTIWIDPEANFNARRLFFKKISNAKFSRKFLISSEVMKENVIISEIEKRSFITGFTSESKIVYRAPDPIERAKKIYIHKNITFRPDYKALNAFDTSFIPEGTRVTMIGQPNMGYIWKNDEMHEGPYDHQAVLEKAMAR